MANLIGTQWIPGVRGNPDGAVMLAGKAGSYVEIPAGVFNTPKSMTVLIFVKVLANKFGPILNYARSERENMQLWQSGGGSHLMVRVTNPSSMVYGPPLTASVLNTGKWNYVGLTYSHETGAFKLWHEGKEVSD